MDITTAAQRPVSEFLNVAQELVTEVREWASVLWVRVTGFRPRFVSKKVIKMENPPKKSGYNKPYSQLKNALSALSGISPIEVWVKIENQAAPFMPEVNIYHVWQGGSYSEDEVNQHFELEKTIPGSYDSLSSWDGTRQGYVH
jgi:hypothetical protein